MVDINRNNNTIKVDVGSTNNVIKVSVGSAYKADTITTKANASEIYANLAKEYSEQAKQSGLDMQGQIEEAVANSVAQASIQADRAEAAAIEAEGVIGVVEQMLDMKADKATTLSGYDISDAYTKTETDDFFKNTLTKSQITNCILEAPHMVDLELSGGTLTLKAGSKVIVPYGTSEPTMAIGDSLAGCTIVDISWDGSLLFYIVEMPEISASSLGTVTGKFMMGLRFDGAGSTYWHWVSTTQICSGSTAASSALRWYDTTNNYIKGRQTSSSEWVIEYGSLPFFIGQRTSGAITSIDQIFQHIGYIGSTVWAMKGIKALIPNGRNEDGSLNNVEYVQPRIAICTTSDPRKWNLNLYEKGSLSTYTSKFVFTQAAPPSGYSGNLCLWFDTLENIYKWTEDKGVTWTKVLLTHIGTGTGAVTSLTSNASFQAVDYYSILTGDVPVVIEKYQNGSSWYRVWSDNWCEQGGVITASGTTTFLKPFESATYALFFGMLSNYTGGLVARYAGYNSKTATGFTHATDSNSYKFWEAKGYI